MLTGALMFPPHFNASMPENVQFGAIGSHIGHEIFHAFDPTRNFILNL